MTAGKRRPRKGCGIGLSGKEVRAKLSGQFDCFFGTALRVIGGRRK